MHLKLFLVSLAIVSVVGQECIPGAVYDSSTWTCKCKEGQIGNPDLCCYHPSEKLACTLSDDLQLTTISKSEMTYVNPCLAPIGMTSNSRSCSLRLYMSFKEIEMGRVYPARATVKFRPRRRSRNVFIRFNAESNPAIIVEGDYPRQTAHFGERVVIDYRKEGFNETVIASHNKRTRMFHVEGCGTRINVRLVSDDKMKQVRIPGMCIVAPKESWFLNVDSCNEKTNLTALPREVYLSKIVKPMRRMISRSYLKYSHPKNKDVCYGIGQKGYRCGFRSSEVRHCAEMLLKPSMKECFYKKAGGDANTRISRAIKNCIGAMCARTTLACNEFMEKTALKECAPFLPDCSREN